MARVFHGPTGHAPRHLPFRRAALVVHALAGAPGCAQPARCRRRRAACGGGRATSDCCATDAKRSRCSVGWLANRRRMRYDSGLPNRRESGWAQLEPGWPNASIVGAYLEYQESAEAESAPERFFMNVALARVLYAHALNAAPRLALGQLAALGRVVGDPRLGMAGVFLSLHRVLPTQLSTRVRRRELHRRRTTSRPTARLRGARPSATERYTSGGPMSSPSRACSSSFATATRSMPGLTRSDVCGARPPDAVLGRGTRTHHASSLRRPSRGLPGNNAPLDPDVPETGGARLVSPCPDD